MARTYTTVAGQVLPLDRADKATHVERITACALRAMAHGTHPYWYATYSKLILDYAAPTSLTPQQAVAIFAVLSPRLRIALNWKMYCAVLDGTDVWTLPVFDSCKHKLAGILGCPDDIFSYLTGVKVNAFYWNLMGDENMVTVDTWAIACMLGGRLPEDASFSGTWYVYIADRYRDAALLLGIAPRRVQELCWMQFRHECGWRG